MSHQNTGMWLPDATVWAWCSGSGQCSVLLAMCVVLQSMVKGPDLLQG